ncbi:hypothetical protein E1091_03435 [Micromonospora fluostatini]|uniref:Uncharacterized protein n=1 Tax=Micromonospora fluostatini TaxID=1629071 RepID=A0ABY2DKE4_9ACTN|nr:hypothetical protein E1091_03435 [Micromonospora fluostatini]
MIHYERPTITSATVVTGTLAQAAELIVTDTLTALEAGEAEHYGRESRRVEVFYLHLNGPDARAVFVLNDDGDLMDAFITYTDSAGKSVAPVPDLYVDRLHRALSAYPG